MIKKALIRPRRVHWLGWLLVVLYISSLGTPVVLALTKEDRLQLNTPFYDPVTTSSSCGAVFDGSENAETVWNFFISVGLTPIQAAGIMGNLQAESGFNPGIQERDPKAGRGGFGIAQWTGGRRVSLEEAAREKGVDITDLGFQLQYLFDESNSRSSRDYPGISEWAGLKQQTDLRAATYYWENNFERPAVAGQEIRFTFATALLARFESISPTAITNCVVGGTDSADPDQDTSNLECPEGTTDKGVVQDYGPGRVPTVKIKLCDLPTVTQVNASIAKAALDMVNAAEAAGYHLSGDAWRSYDEQAALRRSNGCPDVDISPSSSCRVHTARAGSGTHEVGLAIDFNNMCFPEPVCPSSAAWRWLMENAATYGFKKYSAEAWHWSPSGR